MLLRKLLLLLLIGISGLFTYGLLFSLFGLYVAIVTTIAIEGTKISIITANKKGITIIPLIVLLALSIVATFLIVDDTVTKKINTIEGNSTAFSEYEYNLQAYKKSIADYDIEIKSIQVKRQGLPSDYYTMFNNLSKDIERIQDNKNALIKPVYTAPKKQDGNIYNTLHEHKSILWIIAIMLELAIFINSYLYKNNNILTENLTDTKENLTENTENLPYNKEPLPYVNKQDKITIETIQQFKKDNGYLLGIKAIAELTGAGRYDIEQLYKELLDNGIIKKEGNRYRYIA